ncbi:cyclin-domain-containing protein [Trametes polyzona]|nr:cyclin-domain-containing protein [Trametes polyzona]
MHGLPIRSPLLPPSPDPSPMSTAALQLPQELVHTWAHWRPTKNDAPPTPPHSTVPHTRVVAHQHQHQHQPHTVLPPISYFDRSISRHSPVTPPPSEDYAQWDKYDPSSYRLPAVVAPPPRSLEPSPSSSTQYEPPEDPFASTEYNLDWFGSDSHRSSRFIAEKTCEMVCYLWFSTLSSNHASPSKRNRAGANNQHGSFSPNSNSSTATLQFSVSPAFVRFMQKVLETTQVSQSVIVLSLRYIYRLKARNPYTSGQAGSEYRVAIAALMLANKFVDDNTYTNKTWSEVSGIELSEVNRMEREFLLGIDFGLYVDKTTYESWLNLLKGLVMAKERDAKHWQRSRCPVRTSHLHRPHCHRHAHTSQSRAVSHRARSSSPRRSSICAVSHPAPRPQPQQYTPATLHYPPYASPAHSDFPAGSKRSASAAFSPTSASFPAAQQPPAQVPRRTHGLTLDIPQPTAHSRDSSASPLESLQSFSKLSLGHSPADNGPVHVWPAVRHDDYPRTLVSAYRMDDQRQAVAPQNLYFYSLAGSPMESEEERRSRKARLRYHQAPMHTGPVYHYQPSVPMVVQSASTSPYEMPVSLPAPQHTLPPFSEVSQGWADANGVPIAETAQLPPIHIEQHSQPQPQTHTAVPSAPFANAGPPGVHFYSTLTPDPGPHYYRTRGRQV